MYPSLSHFANCLVSPTNEPRTAHVFARQPTLALHETRRQNKTTQDLCILHPKPTLYSTNDSPITLRRQRGGPGRALDCYQQEHIFLHPPFFFVPKHDSLHHALHCAWICILLLRRIPAGQLRACAHSEWRRMDLVNSYVGPTTFFPPFFPLTFPIAAILELLLV